MKRQTEFCQQLIRWYQTPIGQAVEQAIDHELSQVLPELFGYFVLQLGLATQSRWLASSPIKHKFFLTAGNNNFNVSTRVDFCALPIMSDSVDVVVLPHMMEIFKDPTTLLFELDRILVPEGHVITFGINPFSCWGTYYAFQRRWGKHPWPGFLHSAWKIRGLLNQQGFDVIRQRQFFYRPPLSHQRLFENLLFVESVGRMIWPFPGGLYFIVAKKRVSQLTPIRPIWQFRKYVFGTSSIHEPG